MPWFSALTGGLGEENPYDAIGRASDEMQRRNRAAVGLDANGNPLPTDANGNPVAPAAADNGQGAALGQALASGQQQPGQQPNATKSDPSMGHLLANLVQYQQREQGFNQAMGAGFGAISQPRDREWVSKIFNVNEPDANQFVQQQQNLASQQQGQDRTNALLDMVRGPQGVALAKANNMTQAQLIALATSNPGAIADLQKNIGQPTEVAANVTQMERQMQAEGRPQAEIDRMKSLARTGILPPQAREQAQAEIAWNADPAHANKPIPWRQGDPASFAQWKANQAELNDTASKAAVVHSTAAPTLMDMQHRVDAIKSNPALDTMMSNQAKKDQAQLLLTSDPNLPWAVVVKTLIPSGQYALNPDEMKLVAEIRQLNGQEYAAALGSLHQTRPAEKEIAAIRSGIGQTQMISEMDAKGYREQALDNLTENVIKPAIGTSYGSSQLLGDMPAEYRTYVPPEFLEGGGRALENNGSGGWAAGTKITPEELQTAKNWQKPVSQGGQGLTHAQAVAKVREMGIRPDGV